MTPAQLERRAHQAEEMAMEYARMAQELRRAASNMRKLKKKAVCASYHSRAMKGAC